MNLKGRTKVQIPSMARVRFLPRCVKVGAHPRLYLCPYKLNQRVYDLGMITVRCGNKYCANEVARVGEICGNVISSPEDKCDHVNYSIPKCVSILRLIFNLPQVPDVVKEQLLANEEICIDLADLKTVHDSETFFQQNLSSEYEEFVCRYLANLLLSWGNSFGTTSSLNPDPSDSEPTKFGEFDMTLEGDVIKVGIEIELYMRSYQHDMLAWYSKTLAEDLMNKDDLVWMHDGSQITLSDVEILH
jgi:hypothetical protein